VLISLVPSGRSFNKWPFGNLAQEISRDQLAAIVERDDWPPFQCRADEPLFGLYWIGGE
jgi:hypothetical protein